MSFMWLGLAVAVIIALWMARTASRSTGIGSRIAHAAETGELHLLVEAIEQIPEGERPTHWDQAIGRLWQEYARDTATRLVKAAAERSEADIIQYWIQRVHEVEPELAEEHFDEEFMERYFRPEVARQCGRSSCCG